MEPPVRPPVGCDVPFRRLEDRIRELCSRLVSAEDGDVEPLISELRSALREHNQQLRKLAAAKLASSLPCRSRPSP